MKNEAHYYLQHLIEQLGYTTSHVELTKIKQSNKKPCYTASFDVDNCSIKGFIFQQDDNMWAFNIHHPTTTYFNRTITQSEFNIIVKESSLLQRKLQRSKNKEAKINLSQKDIKNKTIAIKKERIFKHSIV